MQKLTWLAIWKLSLDAEKRGDLKISEKLERLALITAYNAGFFDDMIPENGKTFTSNSQGQSLTWELQN